MNEGIGEDYGVRFTIKRYYSEKGAGENDV